MFTTPSNYVVTIGVETKSFANDFGFLRMNPTAIELIHFTADLQNGAVLLEWATALELNTLGFNLYRSEYRKGPRTRINKLLIRGEGAAGGATYQLWDTAVKPRTVYYYWLEEVETDYDRFEYGPLLVDPTLTGDGDVLATATVQTGGLHRIRYETLIAAGVAIGQIDPNEVQVVIDGVEAPSFVTAYGGVMIQGDAIMFYAPGGANQVEIRIEEDASRMGWEYVAPVSDLGDVWHGVAPNSTVNFITDSNYVRYILTGFSTQPVWTIDITDASDTKMLYGAATLVLSNEVAAYLSYGGDSAACLAVDESAVIEVLYVVGTERFPSDNTFDTFILKGEVPGARIFLPRRIILISIFCNRPFS